LLFGELKPVTGSIESHQATSIGYFGQTNIDRLHKDKSIEQELYDSDPSHNKKKVMNICGSMLFGSELAQKKIGVLSGGERSRVLLGKILLSPTNLLLLDEPANHLDMESSDSFMSAVDIFPGAVILVTHNEVFLHTLVKRLIVFDKGTVSLFEGSYQDFLDKTGWEHERYTGGTWISQRMILPTTKAEELPNQRSNRNELRKQKAEIVAQRAKCLKPIKERIRSTERLIEVCESELHNYNSLIIRASEKREGERIGELSITIHDLKSKINGLYAELEKILEEQKKQEEVFELQLKEL
jgi:ATP-binding cassette subfamily F protein 3